MPGRQNFELLNQIKCIGMNENSTFFYQLYPKNMPRLGLALKRLALLAVLVLFIATGATAQKQQEVTGTVKDAGDVLIGVTVKVKGTTIAAVTNIDGKFTIKVPSPQSVLVFTYLGYDTQEIVVGNQTQLSVTMSSKNKSLNEVVVVGYGAAKKKDVTGSVAVVDLKDVQQAPVASLTDALGGRVPGVQVTSPDGQPGSPVNIVVRGTGTFTSNSGPLFVIDGFPSESNDFSLLNPNDIESMSVLKDASATAIYGARGANGVIIVTTKKGVKGQPNINYNMFYGQQTVLHKMPVLGAYDFVRIQQDLSTALNNISVYNFVQNAYFSNGKTLDSYKNVNGINWQDQVFQTAPFVNHTLSISGANGTTNYYISGNMVDQTGLILNSGFSRYSGKVNLEQQVNPNVKIGVLTNYASTKAYGIVPAIQTSLAGNSSNSSPNQTINFMYSLWTFRPVNGSGNPDDLLNTIDDQSTTTDQARWNPMATALNEVNNGYSNVLSTNSYAEVKFLKDFLLRVTGGITLNSGYGEVFHDSQTRGGSQLITASGLLSSSLGPNGTISNSQNNSYLNENTLTYDKQLNVDNHINVLAGFTDQFYTSRSNSLTAIKVPNEILGVSDLDEGTPYAVGSTSSNSALLSFLGRVNYSFKNRYLFTVNMRADGSSKFAPGHKWGYFPSGAFAWRLSEEQFIKKLNVFDDAKFRVTYGLTGNNRVSDFAYASAITTPFNSRYTFNNSVLTGSGPATIYNPNLTWETAGAFDMGLDLGFFKSRVSITADVYDKRTYNLLLNAAISPTTGFLNAMQNIGSIDNRGLELAINTINIDKKKFRWSTSFNISFNRNRVIQYNNGYTSRPDFTASNFSGDMVNTPSYIGIVGQPAAQFFGYIYDGLYQLSDFNKVPYGQTASGAPNYKYILKDGIPYFGSSKLTPQPGDIKYRDLNGDGVINIDDYTTIGSPYPIHFGGITNNFTLGQFDLSVFLQWSYGNKNLNANTMYMESNSTGDVRGLGLNYFAPYADYWSFNNPNGQYPSLTANAASIRAFSTRLIEDASFLRIKTVSFGYNLPKSVLQHIFIKSARLFASAQNLYTFTKYSGPDPEVSVKDSPFSPSFDYSPYPRTRVITFGANISL